MYTHVNNDIRFDDYTEMNRKGGESLESLSQSEDSSDVESARMNTPCNSVCSNMVGDVDIRRNSFLGFCSKNNIDFDVDCIQHNDVFDVIETKCETILNNDVSRDEKQSDGEAKRLEDATRLEEEAQQLEETKRVEEAKRLEEAQRIEDSTRLEEETKRLEETKRVEEAQRIEDATRLEEETKQLEETKKQEDTNVIEEQKHVNVEEAKESTTNQQPDDISQDI
jgi:hypothetical protein